MANWNLSVDLRGHGNDLAQSLKSSAKHARSLANAARTAKTEVRELGAASQTAGRHIRTLGSEARTAARRLTVLGNDAQNVTRRLDRYGSAAQRAQRHVNALGDDSRTAGRQLARMSGQIDTAIRDLLRLADAARRADARMSRLGDGGLRGMRRYREETSRAHSAVRSLAGLLAAGGLTLGAAEVAKEGAEYQQAMNAFGATTGATQMQMQRAAATASQLGNDLRLPGASAADAAEAMVELAKAGFRTDQAISATRASLVLASAAQVNAADSAKYLGDMMDQFGMGADQAGVAADTLAATANAASGDIIDIYYAMKYAGPVAHGLGVNMQEAAAAVGMLGKAGILGQTAGTTLRGMMANLAAPTKQMTEGLKAMGIQAWDAQGNFKGLRYVIDGLSKAQHRMTQQDFAAAVKKAMGKPAMSGAIALAHQGVDSFDALVAAVSETGAASEIAAAKGKGLAGAMLQLKTQARQTGLTIYQGMAPGLEFLVRGVTDGLNKATPRIEHFFKYINDLASLMGPDIAAAARQELSGIADAASNLADPFKDLGGQAVTDFLHLLLSAGQLAIQVLENLADGVEPVVSALGDLSGEGGTVASVLDTVVTALDLAATAVGALSGVLGPLGHLVGGMVSAFGALPGPMQQFVIAALLARRITPAMAGVASTVSGRVTTAFRGLNDQMRVQRTLAAASGITLSRYGAAFAVLQTRVPVVGRMASSFRTASAAGAGFTGTLRGIGAASLTATRAIGGGLMGALGGPWGLAITAATVGLGFLASKQQQAAAAAAQHQQQISSLSTALRESNGVVNESVRAIATENLMQSKVKTTLDGQQRLVDVARKARVPMSQLVDAYTNQGKSLSELKQQLEETADAQTTLVMDPETGQTSKSYTVQGRAAADLRKTLGGLSGDFKKAAADAKAYNEGVNGTGNGVSAYDRLKTAVGALADKTADADSRTRALREALDLLSGGSVSLQAAQARVNEAITNANEALANGVDKADGWGKALVNANGTINTVSKNGQSLFNTLTTIADGSASAATAAYDLADAQGKELPDRMKAAQGEMQRSRDAAISLAQGYGMSKAQAEGVADAMGLIPGQVSILLSTQGVDTTLAELLAVQAAFKQTPNAKTIKVDALSADAKQKLLDLGYTIKLIPGTREYKVTAPTAGARQQLDLLIQKLSAVPGSKSVPVNVIDRASGQAAAIQRAINAIRGKTVTINTVYHTLGAEGTVGRLNAKLNGYADGGIVQHAADGLYVPGYAPRRDTVPAILSPGEGVLVPEAVRKLGMATGLGGRGTIKAINAWARYGGAMRFADGGLVEPQHFADGGVTDWRYDPQSGSLYSATDAGQAGHKTKKVKVKGKTKEIDYFDIGAVEAKLKSASKATVAWNKDLEAVADRAGGDVAQALASMGEDGMKLAHKMATGSTAYINDMAKALRNLQATAKASLTDYTRQLSKANTLNKQFSDNLTTLAARGYGDLASQLAAQNDEAAQQLAAAAVANNSKASAANAQAKTANNALTAEQVTELVQIIAAISTAKTGIHDVASKTGLGEDEIITVANKAKAQISKSLGTRASKFLTDLGRANQHLSYANGGVRAGMYATQGGIIRFAEPETGGEAFLPLSPSKRRSAMPVLADVARRFGVGLTDASAGRPVVIVRHGDTTQVTVTPVRTGASASDIGFQVGRSVRRARRGGVAARAA
ncbi:phage tail tape measure protein [Streptomyces longwoodensis]|uniref:phage tail tape measure protein n=1 Tax=Streptomyces longwoodensis TaxID=68231 RepID=UPI002252D417|nr:phage tail tape measure protein [Streptomyces longwoodensis]MCX5000985.1 phage tail tape measure protein [Streptomyces longwoodensis]